MMLPLAILSGIPVYCATLDTCTASISRFMVARVGHPATICCEPRQARKGATVTADSCAGARRARAATYL